MALGTILGALGQAFGGYADDKKLQFERQRQQTVDQDNAELHSAQKANYQSETAKRQQQIQLTQRMQSPEFENDYVKALDGDPAAEIRVRRIAGLHDQGPAILKALDERDKGDVQKDDAGKLWRVYRDNRMVPISPTQTPQRQPAPPSLTGGGAAPASTAAPTTTPAQPTFGAKDHYTFPTGAEGVLRANTVTGEVTPTGQAGKPAVLRATDIGAKARLRAGISEMNNSHTNMSDYERQLMEGKANISGLSGFLGRAANTFTHDDPASQALQSSALDLLNNQNPELARYIRRGLSFAEGEGMISQRPSDYRTKMAAFLSQAGAGATPEMIRDIQGRRNAIMTPLNEIQWDDAPTTPTAQHPQRRATDKAKTPPKVSYDRYKHLLEP